MRFECAISGLGLFTHRLIHGCLLLPTSDSCRRVANLEVKEAQWHLGWLGGLLTLLLALLSCRSDGGVEAVGKRTRSLIASK